MNIGFVVHDYDTRDGHGRYAVELVARICRRHDVTVYAANFGTPVPDGVKLKRVPAVERPAHATILSFPAAFALVRGTHDLVHVQGWSAPSADVATAHIVLGAWRRAALEAAVYPGIGERLFGSLVEAFESSYYRRRAGTVLAPSRRVQADLAECYGRTERVTVIPHGFSPAPALDKAESRSRFGLPADAFVALYVGDVRKGLDTAMRAVAAVPGVRLLVVSRSRLLRALEVARSLGIADRVWWVEGMPDTSYAYAASDVLLHPSIYDAFGLVVSEAMSYGVPPVVSSSTGVAELVEDRVSGWIVRAGVPDDSAAALRALREDPSLASRLGSNARSVAESRSWNVVAEETMAVYEQVRTS